jgi:hypothetical protein
MDFDSNKFRENVPTTPNPKLLEKKPNFTQTMLLSAFGIGWLGFLIFMIMRNNNHWKIDLSLAACFILDVNGIAFVLNGIITILSNKNELSIGRKSLLWVIGFLSICISYLIHSVNSIHYSSFYLIAIIILAILNVNPINNLNNKLKPKKRCNSEQSLP